MKHFYVNKQRKNHTKLMHRRKTRTSVDKKNKMEGANAPTQLLNRAVSKPNEIIFIRYMQYMGVVRRIIVLKML